MPVHDMEWLRGWAAAVVDASKTDFAERAHERDYDYNRPKTFDRDNSLDLEIESRIDIQLGTEATAASMVNFVAENGEKAPRDYQHGHHLRKRDLQDHEGEIGGVIRGVGTRRRAMKAAVREKYAFSGTAKLWVAEIEGDSS